MECQNIFSEKKKKKKKCHMLQFLPIKHYLQLHRLIWVYKDIPNEHFSHNWACTLTPDESDNCVENFG